MSSSRSPVSISDNSITMAISLLIIVSIMATVSANNPHISPYSKDYRVAYEAVPACSKNTTKSWCIEDSEYLGYDIQNALDQHYDAVLDLYKDVAVKTEDSVDGLNKLFQETYLCPSTTSYVQPLRAINVDGKWRVVVNKVESYGYKFDQHVRIEECDIAPNIACPLVPSCYDSKCVQKNISHRFLIFDPSDHYFPFAVESFKLPASCACVVGAYLP